MANEKPSGLGTKRPQLDISIDNLYLDNKNPRLSDEVLKGSELDIIKILNEEFDIEELAYSMSENGYFDEEPIVVVPDKLPKGFNYKNFPDPTILQKELEKLIIKENIHFWVVEGNRRIATAKLLTNEDLRKKVGVNSDFPKPKNKLIEDDLKHIPSIIYFSRQDVSPYLGIRHIQGILKWDAYAKALYISRRIEEEQKKTNDFEKAIKVIKDKIADRSDVIKRQYMYYKIVQQAEEDISFDIREIKNRFSLVQVVINSPSIRDFMGVKSYNETDFNKVKKLVPKTKLENLERILTWVFGNGKDKQPILTDSRKITSRLAPVLLDEESTKYLIDYGDLEAAYERSGGERRFLLKKIYDAKRNITNALTVAYKYNDSEVKEAVEECREALTQLRKMINNEN